MTRDDIIRMAREVDLHERVKDGVGYVVRIPSLKKLERFAALVAAEKEQQMIRDGWRYAKELEQNIKALMKENARLVPKSLVDACIQEEREACAKLCEKEQFELTQDVSGKNGLQHFDAGCRSCAEMIRARGK